MTKVLVPERSRCFLPSLTALFLALGLAFTGVLSSHGPGAVASAADADRLKAKVTVTGSKVVGSWGPGRWWPGTVPGQVHPATVESGSLVRVGAFRADARFAGISGVGYAAVILDSGIDQNHPFFGPDANHDGVADRIVFQYNFAESIPVAQDFIGHGSNVSSIVGSSDATHTGMAPGVNIIHLKVSVGAGGPQFGAAEQALQWVISNAAAYNIVSLNMSFGLNVNLTAPDTQPTLGIYDELATLNAMGIIVCSAAGNSFFEFSSQAGVGYPAADPNSLSISAVFDAIIPGGFDYGGPVAITTAPDRVAPFSQRHVALTTLMAPGDRLTGANYDGTQVTMFGTSQASPLVTGLVVLAQQTADRYLDRRLTVAEFVSLAQSSAAIINDGDDEDDNVTNTGDDFPRIDMLALADAILAISPSNIFFTNADTVRVPEGGTATFTVRLSDPPTPTLNVLVSHSGGDTDIGVDPRTALLSFDTNNWYIGQTVTLAAAEDADTVTASASITCSALGWTTKFVTATERENDGIATLTVFSAGSGTGMVSVDGVPQTLPYSDTFPLGTIVSLAATPSASATFTAWSGALTGTATPTQLLIDANKAVTATFDAYGIRGMKWHDLDGDGEMDPDEPGIEGWTIFIDDDANGELDPGETSTETDSEGRYAFDGLAPGTYIIAEQPRDHWTQTFPSTSTGTASAAARVKRALASITTTGSDVSVYIDPLIPVEQPGLIRPKTLESGPLIRLDEFRADSRFSSFNGAGYAVAVLDTGIDVNHPFFGPDGDVNGVADRIVYQQDFGDVDMDASDANGHGSNVCSIVASQDSVYRGMGPACDIIALKVFTDAGAGNFAMVEQALQWVMTNAGTYNIVAINLSLSDQQNHSTPQQLYGVDDEIAALNAMGVLVVAASGNDFFAVGSVPGVAYPSADPNALSVGAVFDADVGPLAWVSGAVANSSGPDRLAPFSQRHATLSSIFAPGAIITGADNVGGTAGLTGTSQASPHIAGIAALMQELADTYLKRRLTTAEFLSLMRANAVSVVDGDDENDNVTNTGDTFLRVDVYAMAEAIVAMAAPPPGTHRVVLLPQQSVTDIDFGNQQNMSDLTVTQGGTGSGQVTVNGMSVSLPYSQDFLEGTQVTLTAHPGLSATFTGWTGDVVSAANTISTALDSDKNLAANFTALPPFTLTIDRRGSGSGRVNINGVPATLPATKVYQDATVVVITPVPEVGSEFAGWLGDVVSSDNPLALLVDHDVNLFARFSVPGVTEYTLTTRSSPTEGGTVTPPEDEYAAGTPVTVTATPNEGFLFSHWVFDLSAGWARTVGGTGADAALDVFTSRSGDAYLTGRFQGTADFDPSPVAEDSHTATGDRAAFVTMLNASSSYGWTRAITGTSAVVGNGVAADTDGNVYVVGSFTDVVDLDPGAGSDERASAGADDVFVAKLDSDGDVVWAHSLGGVGPDVAHDVAVNSSSGLVYVAGFFHANMDFDPTSADDYHSSQGQADVFLAAFGTDGTYQWTRTMGGTGSDEGRSVQVGPSGEVVIAGGFEATIDFDSSDPGTPSSHTSQGDRDVFVVRLDSAGTYGWSRAMGGVGEDLGSCAAVDASGNVLVAGHFLSTVDFDPSASTDLHSAAGLQDVFVTRFNSAGSYSWTRTMGGSGDDRAEGVAADQDGSVYVAGAFQLSVDFDPTAGADIRTSQGAFDAFVTRLTSAGAYGSTNTFGGTSDCQPMALSVDQGRRIYLAGQFRGSADFDPTAASETHQSAGSTDIFIAKLNGDQGFAATTATANPVVVVVDSDHVVTGHFDPVIVDYELTILIDPPGSGAVSPTSGVYTSGTVLTLTPTPNSGYIFSDWTGDVTSTANPLAITVNSDMTLTAHFVQAFALAVSINPPGAGTVTPASGLFPVGTVVTLTPQANPGWLFSNWTGSAVGASSPLTVTMNTNITLVAHFTAAFELTTLASPPGAGTITPASGRFLANSAVAVTATPSPAFLFDRWRVNIGGSVTTQTANPLGFVLTNDATVTGYFIAAFVLTTEAVPPGTGQASPETGTYAGGTVVTVTALPGTGYDFSFWEGNTGLGWTRGFGGSSDDTALSVWSDGAGAVYVAGTFQGTVDFDPGPGVATLTSQGGLDVFASKFRSDGTHVWTVGFGGSDTDQGTGIAVDSTGNVFVAGEFRTVVDFNPGAGVDSRTSVGGNDIFITKLDRDGAHVWTRTIGGIGADTASSAWVDRADRIHVTGYFSSSVDFDPSPALRVRASQGGTDIYHVIFTDIGACADAASMGGAGDDWALGVSLDAVDNVYLTGYFNGTADFDPGDSSIDERSSQGGQDVFVTKLNAGGSYGWTRTFGGPSNDTGFAVRSGAAGDVFVTGSFQATVDFNPSAAVDSHTSNGGSVDVFLTRLNANGAYGWTRTVGGTSTDSGRCLTLGPADGIFLAGSFQGAVDFDPTAGEDIQSSAGSTDVFVSRLNPDGTYEMTQVLGSSGEDAARAVMLNTFESVILGGYFSATVDFDPSAGIDPHTAAGGRDVFVSRLNNRFSYEAATASVNPLPVIMDTDRHLVAHFRATNGVRLTINLGGVGNGQAEVNGAGQDLPYVAGFAQGSIVTLTALPAFGSVFTDWTGAVTSTAADIQLLMDGPKTLTASFSRALTLTTVASPAWGGSVSPTTGPYLAGAVVTITATPTLTYEFSHFASDPEGTTTSANPVVVTMTANRTVTAHFNALDAFWVVVNSGGTGSGSLDLNGTPYALPFSQVIYRGTVLSLTAVPDQGSLFDSWSGAMTTGANPISFVLAGDTTLTANFVGGYVLTVTAEPSAGGVTTPTVETYLSGTVVAVTATANPGFRFSHWSGGLAIPWTQTFGGTNSDKSAAAALDSLGNVFVCGRFEGEADFDPTSGVDTQESEGMGDAFVTKLSHDGTYGWTRALGGSGEDVGRSLAVGTDGAVYLAGTFQDTVNFDRTAATDTRSAVGDTDLFVTKLNGDGSYGWTRTLGGTDSTVAGLGVALDVNAAVYLTGHFSGTVDFDPTSGVDTIASAGNFDVFVTKINPDGSYGWTRTFGGAEEDVGNSIWVASSGALYVSGRFEGTVDFDPNVGTDIRTSRGGWDIFLTKLTSEGFYLWSATMGDAGQDIGVRVRTDSSGNVYLTGEFSGTVDFDPTAGVDLHSGHGSQDVFVTRLSSVGGYLWTRTVGGTGFDVGNDVVTDSSGSAVYVAGNFENKVDFDPGSGTDARSVHGGRDAFLLKLTNLGEYQSTRRFGGAGNDTGAAVAVGRAGHVVMAGHFNGTADLTGADADKAQTSAGADDVFVTRCTNVLGAATTETTNPLVVLMNEDKVLTAHFDPIITYSLTVRRGADGAGSIAVDGATRFLPYTAQFERGTSLEIEALPSGGAVFVGWSGDLVSTASSVQFAMAEDKAVTVSFTLLPTVQLILSQGGTGTGQVQVGDTRHVLPYSTRLLPDAVMTLTAAPDLGSHFTGWTGDLVSSSSPVTVTMDADKTIAANFGTDSQITFSSKPAGRLVLVDGVPHATPYVALWEPGTSHTFGVDSPQVEGKVRYVFSRWSDGGLQNRSITAPSKDGEFVVGFDTDIKVTTLVDPPSFGSVVLQPDQGGWYRQGQKFQLTAVANPGYAFSHWFFHEPINKTAKASPITLAGSKGPVTATANMRLQKPDYLVTQVTPPKAIVFDQPALIDYELGNAGEVGGFQLYTSFFASEDKVLDGSDTALGYHYIAGPGPLQKTSAVISVTVASGALPAGEYLIIAKTDYLPGGSTFVDELDETNNEGRAGALTPFVASEGTNLTVEVDRVPAHAAIGQAVQVGYQVSNQEELPGRHVFTRLVLSRNRIVGDGDDVDLGTFSDGLLPGLGTVPKLVTVRVPAGTPAGSYVIGAATDYYDYVAESAEDDNIGVGAEVVVAAATVDFEPLALAVPKAAAAGCAIALRSTVANHGNAAEQCRVTYLLSDRPDPADPAAALACLATRADTIGAGQTVSHDLVVAVPSNAAAGHHYLIAWADRAGLVAEADERNNVLAAAIVLTKAGGLDRPVLLTPVGEVASDVVVFKWRGTHDAAAYDLWVSRDRMRTDPALAVRGLTQTQAGPVSGLARSGYVWWVRAVSQDGRAAWSLPAEFSLVEAPVAGLIAPRPVSPVGEAKAGALAFEWTAVVGATGYDLWVALADGPTPVCRRSGLDRASCTVVLPAGRYRWAVRAQSSAAASPWSALATVAVK